MRNSLGIEDFLKAIQHKFSQELKQVSLLINRDFGMRSNADKYDFLPQEPLGICLVSHVFCALRAARSGNWHIISMT